MPGRLAGKVALITGGNYGIGEAAAHVFAREGAKVALLARRPSEGERVQKDIRQQGGDALFVPCDVSERAGVERAVADVMNAYGALNVVFNNAGGGALETFPDESDETWERVLRLNLTGTFMVCRAAWPHLIAAGGGSIVNIGGQTGHKGAAERAHVITAKAGLAGMTKALAMDLAPHRITVNCVVPGTIDSQRGLPGVPDRPAHRQTVPPIGRRGEPEEIAAMVRMLCGPDARYITGQSIHLNGGGFMP